MKKLAIIIVIAVAIAAAWMLRPSAGDGADSAAPGARGGVRSAVPVTVATVVTREFAERVEAIGTTRAKESVSITAIVTDKITRINFADGDRVDKGTILVELTNDEQSAQLNEAKAERDEALRQLKRLEGLAREGNVSKSQLDEARARNSIAAARLEGIIARLKDRVIRSPFAGVLGFRQVSPGSLVSPGTVITTLDDVSTLKLDFGIPEVYLSAIKLGGEVTARSPAYPSARFTGTVAGIDSRVDAVTRSVTVRAEIPNETGILRPGMLMTVAMLASRRDALAVPESSVVPGDDSAYVYVIDSDGKAQRRAVETGLRQDDFVEINGGLQAGEQVAVLGIVKLRDGALVSVTESAKLTAKGQ